MKRKIALVDDDKNIRTSVAMALEAEGFETIEYSNGADALDHLITEPFDLIILDIKMPRLDGISLLEKLRKHISTPVIFLTSKDDELDELIGLKVGADDYITKPFSIKLLIERINVILRRYDIQKGHTEHEKESICKVGNLEMNDNMYSCYWKGLQVNVTVTEYMILKYLSEFSGQIKTREQILSAAHDRDIYMSDRAVDSHIRRIRSKFKKIDTHFSNIESVYGVGYRFINES